MARAAVRLFLYIYIYVQGFTMNLFLLVLGVVEASADALPKLAQLGRVVARLPGACKAKLANLDRSGKRRPTLVRLGPSFAEMGPNASDVANFDYLWSRFG